jgi:hypothetical protein
MATYIKTLKEDNGDITYPQTKAGAVLLTGGGDLETELAKYVTAEDIASTSALTPPVTTNMIANNAVTSAKIDWSTTIPTATTQTTTATSWFAPTWYKREFPDGRTVYTYTGASTNISFAASGWSSAAAITLPVTFNAATMSASVNMCVGDSAITVCPAITDGSTTVQINWTNQYGGTVTTKVYANVRIEVFA